MGTNATRDSVSSARGRSRLLLRVVLILVLVALVAYLATAHAIERRLERARATHEHGHPLTFRAYRSAPLAPEIANATDYLEAAALVSDGQGGVYLPRAGPPAPLGKELAAFHRRVRGRLLDPAGLSADDLVLARPLVEQAGTVLALLDEAISTAVHARYQTNDDDIPSTIVVPNLLTRLRFSTLLRARGELALLDGEIDRAWADGAAIFRLAHWTAEELPTLINALIARAISTQGGFFAQKLIASGTGAAATRDHLLAEARRIDPRRLVEERLYAERAAVFDSLTDPRSAEWRAADSYGELWGPIDSPLFGWAPWLRLNAALYLETMSPELERCSAPTFERDAPGRRLAEQLPTWAQPARSLTIDCRGIAHRGDLWVAAADQLDLAMRLEAKRESEGGYPPSLEALGGDLPIDPFSGEAYRYRPIADGYLLYSVSINRRDDNGAMPPRKENGAPDFEQADLVWSIARVSLEMRSRARRGVAGRIGAFLCHPVHCR